jgi:hypothetical protein
MHLMDRDIPATRNEIAAQKTRNLVSSDKFVEPNRVGVEGNHNINDLGDIQRVVCVCGCVWTEHIFGAPFALELRNKVEVGGSGGRL